MMPCFLSCRKLKNRVAAQTARDRKKAKMSELEEVVADLEAENKQLAEENSRLIERTGILTTENITLRDRLGHHTLVKKEHTPCESAVLNVPLPQEQVFALSQLMAHCRAILLMLR
jgi:X box-binding protein 1